MPQTTVFPTLNMMQIALLRGTVYSLLFHTILFLLLFQFEQTPDFGEQLEVQISLVPLSAPPAPPAPPPPKAIPRVEEAPSIAEEKKVETPLEIPEIKVEKAPEPEIKPTEPLPKPAPEALTLSAILKSTHNVKQVAQSRNAPAKALSADAKKVLTAVDTALPVSADLQNDSENNHSLNDKESARFSIQLNDIIRKIWRIPPHLAGSGLNFTVKLKVTKYGEVIEQNIETTSGNELLDQSVKVALSKLKQTPQLPSNFPEKHYVFNINFNPKMIK